MNVMAPGRDARHLAALALMVASGFAALCWVHESAAVLAVVAAFFGGEDGEVTCEGLEA